MENEQIRVRIAPSPTGKLHLGTARVALFNYLYAKKTKGKFILRIEDTDRERSKEEFEIDITDNLTWLGINCDEGPLAGDGFGPYRQSERFDIYKKYEEKLLGEEKIYHCFCTQEELNNERETAEKDHRPYIYSGKCRDLSKDEIEKKLANNAPFVLRFKSPSKEIEFDDLIRGEIKVHTKTFGDFVIVKSDGTPLFLFASVVDDVDMKITHIIRGEDHISNTPKQLLLLEALGFIAPRYGHLPLIVNPDRSKLSKRKNPTSISDDYRDKGYLAEALVNFMAFLGWNPGDNREFFTLSELAQEWTLERVGKSPSVFDQKKLDHINGHYIRQKKVGELAELCLPFIEKNSPDLFRAVNQNTDLFFNSLIAVQTKIKTLDEVANLINFFFFDQFLLQKNIILDKKLPEEKAKVILKEVLTLIENEGAKSVDEWDSVLRALAKKNEISDGALLWAVRYILTGELASPGAFEMLNILPKESKINRLKKAIELF